MTEPQTTQGTAEDLRSADDLGTTAEAPAGPPVLPRPTLLTVVRHQRKVIVVGLVLVVACFWFIGQLGEWRTATLTAVGVLLALVNHLTSELWLGRLISSGAEPTRNSIAGAAFARLAVLSVVAVGAAVLFWPNGIGLLLGLAVFRLIALVMTGIPLLKELTKQ